MTHSRTLSVGAAATAAVAVSMVLLPLAGLVGRADWGSLPGDLTSPSTTSALQLSLACATAAAVLATILGTPLAWLLARRSFPGRTLVRSLVVLPMVLPPVVGGVALLAAFGRRSPLGGLLYETLGVQLTFHAAGVVLAETFVALPFLVITMEGAFAGLDDRLSEIAAGLGADRATILRRVVLPQVGPSLAAGILLAWARALGEFGATITFAGNVEGRTRTLPLAIYLDLQSDPGAGVALSIVLLMVSAGVLVALRGRWVGRT